MDGNFASAGIGLSHITMLSKILRRARKGATVFYVPGNHDEAARDFCGLQFGGVLVTNQIVHTSAASGKRFLVLHGDQYDAVIGFAKWLALLGDVAYTFALKVNTLLNSNFNPCCTLTISIS